LLPIKTTISGPAPKSNEEEDIIEETLNLFKANVLFKNYEMKSDGDRTLVYLTFYVSLCLKKIAEKKPQNLADADKLLFNQAQENFQKPGETGFVLGGFFSSPATSQEGVAWASYFKQARQELGVRLLKRVFPDPKVGPTKFWMQYSKRKFLNKEMTK
jgi:actin related protein 2/3 complex subunit 3